MELSEGTIQRRSPQRRCDLPMNKNSIHTIMIFRYGRKEVKGTVRDGVALELGRLARGGVLRFDRDALYE